MTGQNFQAEKHYWHSVHFTYMLSNHVFFTNVCNLSCYAVTDPFHVFWNLPQSRHTFELSCTTYCGTLSSFILSNALFTFSCYHLGIFYCLTDHNFMSVFIVTWHTFAQPSSVHSAKLQHSFYLPVKHVLVPFCSPQIAHAVAWDWTQASAVSKCQWPTAEPLTSWRQSNADGSRTTTRCITDYTSSGKYEVFWCLCSTT